MSGAFTLVHLPPGARRIRLDARPMVSVVVASAQEPELLAACLASLEPQCAQHRAEIVVARAQERPDVTYLGNRYPGVRWIVADASTDVSQLRGLGLAAAHGDIVALTDDRAVVGPQWLAQLFQAGPEQRRLGPQILGGGAGNGAVDWAAYFAAIDGPAAAPSQGIRSESARPS